MHLSNQQELSFLTGPDASPEQPNLARVADWLLGGTQNWEIDRASGRRLQKIVPEILKYTLEGRLFLQRSVKYALEADVFQFVDIGSGLPTQGCVHEVADTDPRRYDMRVVYADHDPVVQEHSSLILREHGDRSRHVAVTAELLRAEELWKRVLNTDIINPKAPVCLIVTGLMHFVKDDELPHDNLAYYREQLATGSLLVLSHPTDEGIDNTPIYEQAAQYHQKTDPGQLRDRAEFAEFFGDFDMVEPGIVFAPTWRPDAAVKSPFADDVARSVLLTGVGRKR